MDVCRLDCKYSKTTKLYDVKCNGNNVVMHNKNNDNEQKSIHLKMNWQKTCSQREKIATFSHAYAHFRRAILR